MDIHWKGKIKFIFLCALSIVLIGCKSSKEVTTTTKQQTVKEIVTKQNPYKLEAVTDLKVDSTGMIEPVKFNLNFGETKAEVTIKDNQATYTLENKDTIVTQKEIQDVTLMETVKEKTVAEKPEKLNWWGRLKKKVNTIAIYVLIVNILFIAYKVTRFIRKVTLPI